MGFLDTSPLLGPRRLRARFSRSHLTMGDDLIRRLGVSAVILIAFTVTLYAFGNLFYNHNKSVPTFWRNGHDPSDDSRSDYFQESWTPPKQTTNFTASNWEFDPDVDGRSYSLTDEQCDIAFPGLFSEIEQSVMSRLGNPITSEDLDENVHNDSNTRAMIYDGDVSSHPPPVTATLASRACHHPLKRKAPYADSRSVAALHHRRPARTRRTRPRRPQRSTPFHCRTPQPSRNPQHRIRLWP